MRLADACRLTRPILLLQACFLLAALVPCAAQEEAAPEPEYVRVRGEQFSLGGDIVVPSNEIRRGEIVNIGGTVRIDGTLAGSVILVGGDVEVSGKVRGEVIAVMAEIELGEEAEIGRGLVNIAGSLEDRGADIGGQFVNADLGLKLPGLGAPLSTIVLLVFWWKLIKLILVFILVLLLAALVGDRVRRIGEEIPARPVLSFFVGFLFCILGVPLIFLLLVVSIVGIPLIPVAILVFMVLTVLGLTGIFHYLGHRLGRLVGRDISLLGSILLGYLLCGLISLVPIFGTLAWTCLTWLGIGLLFTSRMGSAPARLPSGSVAPAAPSEPPAPPAQPVPPEPDRPEQP